MTQETIIDLSLFALYIVPPALLFLYGAFMGWSFDDASSASIVWLFFGGGWLIPIALAGFLMFGVIWWIPYHAFRGIGLLMRKAKQ